MIALDSEITLQIQTWIDSLKAGDDRARAELLRVTGERLVKLTRKMLRQYPGVRRWEGTDDVFQNATLRIYRALGEVVPASPAEFFGFASFLIRRELIDLTRHYCGPEGLNTRQRSHDSADGRLPADPANRNCGSHDPGELAVWTEFHSQIEQLPPDDRTLFDLLWYQGLRQSDAAEVLGATERTVQRRWRQARERLHASLRGGLPGS